MLADAMASPALGASQDDEKPPAILNPGILSGTLSVDAMGLRVSQRTLQILKGRRNCTIRGSLSLLASA